MDRHASAETRCVMSSRKCGDAMRDNTITDAKDIPEIGISDETVFTCRTAGLFFKSIDLWNKNTDHIYTSFTLEYFQQFWQFSFSAFFLHKKSKHCQPGDKHRTKRPTRERRLQTANLTVKRNVCGLRIERSGFERWPGSLCLLLCSRARHFTLTLPLSTQEYKWVPATWHAKFRRVTCDGLASHPGGMTILSVATGVNKH